MKTKAFLMVTYQQTSNFICLDVAEGFSCVNSCGIMHRDVKAQNILIFMEDEPKVPFIGKLSDFGLSIEMEAP